MKRFNQQTFVKENTLNLFSKIQKQLHIMMFISILAIVGAVTLTGCSGGGGSGTPVGGGGGGSVDQDSYEGSAKVAGTIKLSSLTSSDSAQLDSGAGKKMAGARTKAVDPSTEGVKLYVVGEGGELEDTGISCSLTEDDNGDRSYECDGIKDGINYVVRYVQMTATGDALELKASAYVPDGAFQPEEEVEVTPQSSVITEALVAAVLSATSGAEISDDVVNDIIASVKTAIETLVESGTIQIPSMVVDVEEGAGFDDVIGGKTENEKLDNAAGLVLTDDAVDTELGFIASETEAALFDMSTIDTPEEKEAFIRKVFSDLITDDKGESDSMPDVFFNFFTWLYVNNMTKPAGGLLDSLLGSIIYDAAAVNTNLVTTANLLAALNGDLNDMYALLAIDPASLTAQQKADLADFPPIFRGLFPSSILPVTTTTQLNPPQAIAMVVYMEEVFMPDTVEPQGDLSGSSDDSGQINYDDMEVYDWDDGALFTYLGLEQYITTHQSLFTGVDIFELYLHPGTVWVDNQEKDALMCGTGILDLEAFLGDGDDELAGDSGATVTLTYPKASGGTGTAPMVFISRPGDDHSYWGIDPWGEAEMAAGGSGPVDINPARVFSDFTSGIYTITVVYAGETTIKSFEKKVITGLTGKHVKITTPKGMPYWPGDNATQAELDAFNTAWEVFYAGGGRTNFTANVKANGLAPSFGEEATHAKITVSWKAPEVTLPEGVQMVYDLDIGQSSCDPNGGPCSWTPIWNTWENNKRIFTTSATIPYIFPIQTAQEAQGNPYHLNIGVNFVNKATGEYLGRGGNAHTEFTVGEPVDLNAIFTLKGLNSITISDTTVAPENLRVALVKESYNSTTSTSTRTIVRIADIINENGYNLDVYIGDFLSGTTMNTWFNLVLVEDATGALSSGDSLGFEPTYWPNYSSGNMWFDTWGGVLKIGKDTCTSTGECAHEEIVITGGEIIDGPEFYIGQDVYVPPNPQDVTPVPAATLSQAFTIEGSVETTIDPQPTNPQVVLIEEGYDSTLGTHVQRIISIATGVSPGVSGGTYSLSTTVGAFFDSAGLPTDKWFQVILVDAIDDSDPSNVTNVTLAEGDILGYMPMWWPDWSTGNFGFDTWRGGALWVYTESLAGDVWSKTDVEVDTAGQVITGPSLSNTAYVGSVQN